MRLDSLELPRALKNQQRRRGVFLRPASDITTGFETSFFEVFWKRGWISKRIYNGNKDAQKRSMKAYSYKTCPRRYLQSKTVLKAILKSPNRRQENFDFGIIKRAVLKIFLKIAKKHHYKPTILAGPQVESQTIFHWESQIVLTPKKELSSTKDPR